MRVGVGMDLEVQNLQEYITFFFFLIFFGIYFDRTNYLDYI